jgi:hypothetical protein
VESVAQTTQTRNSQPAIELEDVLKRHSPSPDVVVVYDHFQDGMAAKRLFGQVFSRLEDGYEHRVNLWKCSLLRAPALRKQAAGEAAGTAVLCLTSANLGGWSRATAEMVSGWLMERAGRSSALVVLDEGTTGKNAKEISALNSLRDSACQAGVEFQVCPLDPLIDVESVSESPEAEGVSNVTTGSLDHTSQTRRLAETLNN